MTTVLYLSWLHYTKYPLYNQEGVTVKCTINQKKKASTGLSTILLIFIFQFNSFTQFGMDPS